MSAQYGAGNAPHPPELRPLEAGAPKSIGGYTLAGRLAADNTSTLYGALDPNGAPVRVRVASELVSADDGFRSAFAGRVEALGRVSALCVLPFLAADPGAERPWLATGVPVGPTLGDRVERVGPLPHDALFAFAAGTAEALTGVHSAGLCYGEITPDDVVLGPDGPLVVGLGAVDGAGGTAFGPAATTGRAAAGEWAAPEPGDGAAGAASGDVYSWARLVTYAATGRRPDAAEDAGETTDLSGLPEELAPLIELALAADPEARPTAESAYRGLVAFAVSDDTAQVPTPELRGRLSAIIAARWGGTGDEPTAAPWPTAQEPSADADPAAAHPARPADPAASTPAPSEPGSADPADPAAPVGSAGVGASDGPADSGAPSEFTADSAADSAASSEPGSADPAPADPAPVGPGLRRAGAKATAIVTALSMAVAIAIGAGGFLVVGALTGGPGAADASPSAFGTAGEAVAGAVKAVQSTESYRAVGEVEDGDTSEHREYVLATLSGREHFQTITLLGDPEEPAAGSTARIYEPESDRLIEREYGGGTEGQYYAASGGSEGSDGWGGSRKAVLAPLAQLRKSMDVADRIEGTLNGTPGLHISGTFDFTEREQTGGQEHSDTPFDLWVDKKGRPLRFAYTAGGANHEWAYSGFGGLDSRICGVVKGVPDLERAYLVPTRGGMSCDKIRPIVEEYLAIPEEEQQASSYVAEVGEWTCRLSPVPDGSAETQGSAADAGACYRGALDSAERVDLVGLG